MKTDPSRYDVAPYADSTGIYVRAQPPAGKWDSVDIATLDEPSLTEFMLSRGGSNPWAENIVCIMLGWPVRTQSGEGPVHE